MKSDVYKGCPADHEFWFQTEIGLPKPKSEKVPKATEGLVVLKPIGKYRPVRRVDPESFKPDITRIYSKKYPATTRNMTSRIQCKLKLSGENK